MARTNTLAYLSDAIEGICEKAYSHDYCLKSVINGFLSQVVFCSLSLSLSPLSLSFSLSFSPSLANRSNISEINLSRKITQIKIYFAKQGAYSQNFSLPCSYKSAYNSYMQIEQRILDTNSGKQLS